MLNIYEKIPDALLECEAEDLYRVLPGPSLIHIEGEISQPLFVSVLLHGNEITGWLAIREVLAAMRDKKLPRSLSLFIGNIAAAREGVRHLDWQPDYNRIWKATDDHPESVMVRQVLEQMHDRSVFACIDIHNNSGRNPHYACINTLKPEYIQLAGAFSKTVVYFLQPDSVLSRAFTPLCPSVTVECGKPSEKSGVLHAYEYIMQVLNYREFDHDEMETVKIDLFHTVATMKLRHGISIGIDDSESVISIDTMIDQLNFTELGPGTRLASLNQFISRPFLVTNELGQDVTDRYLEVTNEGIYTTLPVMPSMLTLDLDIIRQDCFGYLMEKMAPAR